MERGDRDRALQLLMDGYGRELYRFCVRLTGSEELAEDVHQTVFIQAYRDFGRFRGGASFRVWLYAIARHRCLDALKGKRRRERRVQLTDRLPEPIDRETRSDRKALSRDLARTLRRCLEKLRPRLRSALALRLQHGFSYPEMARISGERPATLQARVSRALPLLRRCLEEKGVEW